VKLGETTQSVTTIFIYTANRILPVNYYYLFNIEIVHELQKQETHMKNYNTVKIQKYEIQPIINLLLLLRSRPTRTGFSSVVVGEQLPPQF